MKEFVNKVDNFKFGFLDNVPIADADQCILLYREGFGGKGAMVIDSYTRPMASHIRHGRFDKIAYLSTQKQSVDYSFEIAMKDYNFNFYVKAALSYSIGDAVRYYFENRENRDSIYRTVDDIVSSCNQKFNIGQAMDLKTCLQTELKEELNKYQTLYFHSIHVSVEGDSDAQRILRSAREKVVKIAENGDETEIKKSEMERDKEIKKGTIQWIVELASQFGSLGPIVDSYSKGEINAEKLYEYIERNKVSELNNLKTAMEHDLLDAEEIRIKTEQTFNSGIGGVQQMAQIETRHTEDEKEKEEYVVDYSPEDGDYI